MKLKINHRNKMKLFKTITCCGICFLSIISAYAQTNENINRDTIITNPENTNIRVDSMNNSNDVDLENDVEKSSTKTEAENYGADSKVLKEERKLEKEQAKQNNLEEKAQKREAREAKKLDKANKRASKQERKAAKAELKVSKAERKTEKARQRAEKKKLKLERAQDKLNDASN